MVNLTELTELRNPTDYAHKDQKQNWAVGIFFYIHELNALTGLSGN